MKTFLLKKIIFFAFITSFVTGFETLYGAREIGADASAEYSPDVFSPKNIFEPEDIVIVRRNEAPIWRYGKIIDKIDDLRWRVLVEPPIKYISTKPVPIGQIGKLPPLASTEETKNFSLTAWTTKCLKQYKEYTSGTTSNFPTDLALTWEQFEKVAQDFAAKHKTTALNKSESWMDGKTPPDDFFGFEKLYNYEYAYVQKKVIDSGSTVFFIGDFHGSLHSLLRLLWHFVAAGYLDDNLKIIKDNSYIVFNGDLVDRGRYSIEVLFTILLLKLNNWDTVFILRGNHEDYATSTIYGFKPELNTKYGDPDGKKHIFASKVFDFFPMALYLGSGKNPLKRNNPYFVQCCHGGIEFYKPKNFLESDNAKIVFEKLDDDKHVGFNWSDFEQDTTGGEIIPNAGRGAGWLADVTATFKYLAIQNGSIKAFFRGHQDHTHVFKMFLGSNLGDFSEKIAALKNIEAKHTALKEKETLLTTDAFDNPTGKGYPDGPYDWREVFSSTDTKEMDANGFLIHKYVPVFTFTTAAEARGLNFDSYGKLTTHNDYKEWRLMPYEFVLDKTRNGKYTELVYNKAGSDSHMHVSVQFTDTPAKSPVPQKLIDLAKENIGKDGGESKKLIQALTNLRDTLKRLSSTLSSAQLQWQQ